MKIILRENKTYILRFAKGEAYPEIFIEFLEKKKIRGGFFVGLGACVNPEISLYDLKRKKYETQRFRGDFEVLNLTGNVAESSGKIILHQHITLSSKKIHAIGGHLQKAVVGGTLEIFFMPTPNLKRKYDTKTGLNLLE